LTGIKKGLRKEPLQTPRHQIYTTQRKVTPLYNFVKELWYFP